MTLAFGLFLGITTSTDALGRLAEVIIEQMRVPVRGLRLGVAEQSADRVKSHARAAQIDAYEWRRSWMRRPVMCAALQICAHASLTSRRWPL